MVGEEVEAIAGERDPRAPLVGHQIRDGGIGGAGGGVEVLGSYTAVSRYRAIARLLVVRLRASALRLFFY